MSVTAAGAEAARPARHLHTLLIALAAVALVGLALAGLGLLIAGGAAPPPAPARHPFGMGQAPAAAPASGLAAWLLAFQADFYRRLTGALAALKESGAAVWTLVTVAFLYGVFHAAGPGHGKAVIAGYIVASERALKRGVALSFAAAALQGVVAVAIVGILAWALGATAAGMNAATNVVETASFAAVALVGAALLWRKAARLSGLITPAPAAGPAGGGHWHLPAAETVDRVGSWREAAGIVAAAGMRPCSGAIVVLVFALAQGLVGAGIAAVAAMALGTALTTSLIAALAVFMKRTALRLASGSGRRSLIAGAALETLAAAFVLLLGLGLLAGYWFAGSAS